MPVRIETNTVLVPDVLGVPAAAAAQDPTSFAVPDVVLAVEVVSEGSIRMDRVLKPVVYAAAGIPHFWRVETGSGIVVHTYDLDATTQTYRSTGIFTAVLTAERPWRLKMPITRLRTRLHPEATRGQAS